ncbi:MAG TPA: SRPBCC family protein [Solirubrobacteraceae bacterium]|nr:SRPBCC family protein [Solirubrobacteraceae bacterium]
MGEVVAQIDIRATPAEVWAIALDPARLGEWVTIHRHLGAHDDGPPRVGFRMTQTLVLRGAPFRVHWELVRCEPPHLAEWHGRGPAHSRAETAYELRERDGGTRFHYRNEFFPPLGFIGRAAQRAIAGHVPEHEALASLERLKQLCEK